MVNTFIVDQVDYWTLQYARRFKLRKGHLRIISFDPTWEQFADDCLILPYEKIKKTKIDLDSYVLEKTDSRYNIAKVVGNNFRPDPNSTYTARIKYSVSEKQNDSKAVLSANFYGEDGRRDFDQVHSVLPINKSWNTIDVTLNTENFRSDEYVNFRLWNILSDAGTKIRIHEITLSKESEIYEDLSKAIDKNTGITTYLPNKEHESVLALLQLTGQCAVLSDLDLYKCEIDAQDFSFKSYCYKKHLITCQKSLCYILKSDHSIENTSDGFVIEENRITSVDTSIRISFDNSPRKHSECLIAPANIDFINTAHEKLGFAGSSEAVNSLRKVLSGNKSAQILFFDNKISLKNLALLVIIDEIGEEDMRQILIDCWSSGVVVAAINSIPVELRNSPIIQTNINEAYDLLENKNILDKYREFGYLATKCRTPSAIKQDIESLVFHSIGNIDDKINRD